MNKQLSYNDIKESYRSTWEIPYNILLELREWKELRERILERDQYTCRMCNKKGSEKHGDVYYRRLSPEESAASVQMEVVDITGTGEMVIMQETAPVVAEPTKDPVILHVHHTYYVHGDAPWEYPEDAFLTLCHGCHVEVHESLVIPTYVDETKQQLIPLTPCTRCSGVGFLKEYLHYQNGICFRCMGRKFEEFIR